DSSVQPPHQSVLELPPSVRLSNKLTHPISHPPIQLIQNIKYLNPPTLQFLLSPHQFFFIHLNPPLQLHHTITQIITAIHILKTQILLPNRQSLFPH
ncbi:ATP-binding protein, partial [Staphylococcus epidermidis]|uniref:ATP-binding protein n=1 Tax=Staphylococcus epidermidis TaxID=1282 RepID=UPI00119CCE97